MSLTKISLLALAGLMSLGVVTGLHAQDTLTVDPAIAAMTPEQMVAARKAAMREDGGLLRGAARQTGAEAVATAETLIRNFTNFPALFPEGSLVADSKALPSIWQNFEAFTAIFTTGQQGAIAMKAAAEAGDAAAYETAFRTVAGTCGTCHGNYRG